MTGPTHALEGTTSDNVHVWFRRTSAHMQFAAPPELLAVARSHGIRCHGSTVPSEDSPPRETQRLSWHTVAMGVSNLSRCGSHGIFYHGSYGAAPPWRLPSALLSLGIRWPWETEQWRRRMPHQCRKTGASPLRSSLSAYGGRGRRSDGGEVPPLVQAKKYTYMSPPLLCPRSLSACGGRGRRGSGVGGSHTHSPPPGVPMARPWVRPPT